ncbi:hypothetical protein KZZ52_30280 [Dactylosporangium sp. AC04546]|uniref:hypothetical protein n=1 Tax=Dactylosporangium sp. AC04546 TaxID=2862460 RepID=UPI001EDF443C|nr:hypothetical protein [Dactylosporangium sp. AC04546]WVK78284.1 hypothetical protein KZZ52_30280 [Dactylosporangium sp. AC04546]
MADDALVGGSVARRWSGVVVLIVAALTFYLITSDRYPEQGPHRPALTGSATASDSAARDRSGQPLMASDGVTLLPRSFVLGPATEQDVPIPLCAALGVASVLGWRRTRPMAWRVLGTLRPRLDVLQVLRC